MATVGFKGLTLAVAAAIALNCLQNV